MRTLVYCESMHCIESSFLCEKNTHGMKKLNFVICDGSIQHVSRLNSSRKLVSGVV